MLRSDVNNSLISILQPVVDIPAHLQTYQVILDYVDSKSQAGITTANNGLTVSANVIGLGGALANDSIITTGPKALRFIDSGAFTNAFVLDLGNTGMLFNFTDKTNSHLTSQGNFQGSALNLSSNDTVNISRFRMDVNGVDLESAPIATNNPYFIQTSPTGIRLGHGVWSGGVRTDKTLSIDANANVSIDSLKGTGSRMVVTDANGTLSAQAIPSGGGSSNIFENGIANITGSTYGLGGSLIQDTTIDAQTHAFAMSSLGSFNLNYTNTSFSLIEGAYTLYVGDGAGNFFQNSVNSNINSSSIIVADGTGTIIGNDTTHGYIQATGQVWTGSLENRRGIIEIGADVERAYMSFDYPTPGYMHDLDELNKVELNQNGFLVSFTNTDQGTVMSYIKGLVVDQDGVKMDSLIGTGNRLVLADATGKLLTAPLPTYSNGVMDAGSGNVILGGQLTQATNIDGNVQSFAITNLNNFAISGTDVQPYFMGIRESREGASMVNQYGNAYVSLSEGAVNIFPGAGSNNTFAIDTSGVAAQAVGGDTSIYQVIANTAFAKIAAITPTNVEKSVMADETGVSISTLKGTGSRMVIADANGYVSTQDIPSGSSNTFTNGLATITGSTVGLGGLLIENTVIDGGSNGYNFEVKGQVQYQDWYTNPGDVDINTIDFKVMAGDANPTGEDVFYSSYKNVFTENGVIKESTEIHWEAGLAHTITGDGTLNNFSRIEQNLNGTNMASTKTVDGVNSGGSVTVNADGLINILSTKGAETAAISSTVAPGNDTYPTNVQLQAVQHNADGTAVLKSALLTVDLNGVSVSTLAGTDNRMVVADATGKLSTAAIPSGSSNTFTNGLTTITGSTIGLGGTLTTSTDITTGANAIVFHDNDDWDNFAQFDLGGAHKIALAVLDATPNKSSGFTLQTDEVVLGISDATHTSNLVMLPTKVNIQTLDPLANPYFLELDQTTGIKIGHYVNNLGTGGTDYKVVTIDANANMTVDSLSHSGTGYRITASDATGLLKQIVASDIPSYADDTAATSGGLTSGDLYKTSAGALMIKL